jgi:Co/Zn/Cd efflux system component
MTATTHVNPPATTRYHLTGMDCARCAVEIKDAVRKVGGVLSVDVSIAAQILTVSVDDAVARLPEVEDAVSALGYPLRRVHCAGEESSVNSDNDELPKDLSHIASAYRRALWIVVLLNIGYGSVEIVAGFIAGSQALKADALDFFGDGVITLLGLLAIRWSLAWRARSALIQGLFLGVLGLSVIGTTIYRIFVVYRPEAELMGIFGAIALIVNVAAALVLIPHRTGDANARAVWLFSRNDAIGNVAVVIAAGLVAWTATPWPDLFVAFAIAALFLQSSWSIIGDALRDLRPTTYGEGRSTS